MNNLKEAKERYDSITIPPELSERVQEVIAQSAQSRTTDSKIIPLRRSRKILRRSMGTAAAAAIAFTVLLNTNTAFAQGMMDIPVIGAVARILTFQSYEKEEENIGISVEIPSLEMISESNSGLADSINEEIHTLCQQYADEALQIALDYRTAFLETGGTEEEWAAHNIQIQVGYELKSQTEDYLSFVITGNQNWSSAYSESRYYNIDLKNEKMVTLRDLLGEDYEQIVNESIQSQMAAKAAETGMEFFTAEEGGFAGITEQVKFYINAANNPVIVFGKYEIAPGAAGSPEFEITK
ncbi:MAG: DUF3298 domain-containing protein [Clostridiales bacterium]|nr:DUF3298 domain-containing protein [Clostridiales bacterium]